MITLERASEIVNALRSVSEGLDTKAEDLFSHFVDFLGLETQEEQEMFAIMCGYEVVTEVSRA